ncbi:MAG: hypothetical protein FWG90_01765 [Oscillospiraceae bacterium]|nr:hypothetical protein [Oscillospiraceae bacterium]
MKNRKWKISPILIACIVVALIFILFNFFANNEAEAAYVTTESTVNESDMT